MSIILALPRFCYLIALYVCDLALRSVLHRRAVMTEYVMTEYLVYVESASGSWLGIFIVCVRFNTPHVQFVNFHPIRRILNFAFLTQAGRFLRIVPFFYVRRIYQHARRTWHSNPQLRPSRGNVEPLRPTADCTARA